MTLYSYSALYLKSCFLTERYGIQKISSKEKLFWCQLPVADYSNLSWHLSDYSTLDRASLKTLPVTRLVSDMEGGWCVCGKRHRSKVRVKWMDLQQENRELQQERQLQQQRELNHERELQQEGRKLQQEMQRKEEREDDREEDCLEDIVLGSRIPVDIRGAREEVGQKSEEARQEDWGEDEETRQEVGDLALSYSVSQQS